MIRLIRPLTVSTFADASLLFPLSFTPRHRNLLPKPNLELPNDLYSLLFPKSVPIFQSHLFSSKTDPMDSDSVPAVYEEFVHVPKPDTSDIAADDPNRIPESSHSRSSSSSSSSPAVVVNDEEGVSNADGANRDVERNTTLPEELSKGVLVLDCESTAESGSCNVYLVGTAHVSQESCRQVQAVIRHLKPQVVFLELCSSRVAILTPQNLQVPTMSEMIDLWKKKKMNTFGILYSWFLAKVANKLEVLPGSEFRVAFEEAVSYGARVILGDRPVQVTLQRTWGKMSLWHRAKFLYSILFQAIFLPSPEDLNKMLKDMDDVDMLTLVVQEMSKEFPSLMETLVYERDL